MTEAQPPESEPESPSAGTSTSRLAGLAALALAVALAIGVVGFLVFSGDGDGDDAPAGIDTSVVPTAIPNLPGAPTPPANTGMIDPNRPERGETAPNFALPDAREPSQVRQLTDYRGKVVVLNFWATWCGPCEREMPEFEKAQQALGDDIVVLAVNYRESPEKAAAFLDEQEVSFPALIDGPGSVAEHYRVPGLPVTYFLDADGVVTHIEFGEVSAEELAEYLTEAGATYEVTD